MARDSTVTSASAGTLASGIVLAGDRTENRAAAHRHSRNVRLLKRTLPLGTLVVAGLYSLSVMQTMGWGTAIPKLEIPQILPENLAM